MSASDRDFRNSLINGVVRYFPDRFISDFDASENLIHLSQATLAGGPQVEVRHGSFLVRASHQAIIKDENS